MARPVGLALLLAAVCWPDTACALHALGWAGPEQAAPDALTAQPLLYEDPCSGQHLKPEESQELMHSAELSSAIYGVDPRDPRTFPPPGFTVIQQEETKGMRAAIWAVLERRDARGSFPYVVYRGTSSLVDKTIDATQMLGLEDDLGLTATWSTLSRDDTLRLLPLLTNISRGNAAKRVVLTGHSLGGAVASMTAYFLQVQGVNAHAYAFNTPPFMSSGTASIVREAFNQHTTLVSSEFDVVSRTMSSGTRPWFKAYYDSFFARHVGFVGKYGAGLLSRIAAGKVLSWSEHHGTRRSLNCTWMVGLRAGCNGMPLLMPTTDIPNTTWEAKKQITTFFWPQSEARLFAPPPATVHACMPNTSAPARASARAPARAPASQDVQCSFEGPLQPLQQMAMSRVRKVAVGALKFANDVARALVAPQSILSPRFEDVWNAGQQHSMSALLQHLRHVYAPGEEMRLKSSNIPWMSCAPALYSRKDGEQPQEVELRKADDKPAGAGPERPRRRRREWRRGRRLRDRELAAES